MASLQEIHEVLWRMAEEAGVELPYPPPPECVMPDEDRIDGLFESPDSNPDLSAPLILLVRPDDPADLDLAHELFTLAHEFGHHQSWKAGHHSPNYLSAIGRPWAELSTLPTAARRLILAEEGRAWEYARDTLQTLGYDAWDDFDARMSASLAGYCGRLRLELDE